MTILLSSAAKLGPTPEMLGQRREKPLELRHIPEALVFRSERGFAIFDVERGLVAGSDYLAGGRWRNQIARGMVRRSIRIEGPIVAALNAALPMNYYHWLYQSFAAALHARREVPRADGAPLRALVASAEGFRGEHLAMVPDLEPVLPPERSVMLVEDLYWSNLAAGQFAFNANPDGIALLRGLTPAKRPPRTGRIYIERGDTAARRVANEADVVRALGAHGFVSHRLTGMPVADQIALFHGAEMVAGPHGAGLTNLAFCQPGTTVIELLQDNYQNACFKNIAHSGELDYHAIVNPTEETGGGHHGDRVQVDIPLLEQLVASLRG